MSQSPGQFLNVLVHKHSCSCVRDHRCIKEWVNLFWSKISLDYLCHECARVVVCAQLNSHLCRFIWVPVEPRLPITTNRVRLHQLQNLSIMGTDNAIPETLQGTLEHQTAYQYTYQHDINVRKDPIYLFPRMNMNMDWSRLQAGYSQLQLVWVLVSQLNNNYSILNKNSINTWFSAIGKSSRIVNLCHLMRSTFMWQLDYIMH